MWSNGARTQSTGVAEKLANGCNARPACPPNAEHRSDIMWLIEAEAAFFDGNKHGQREQGFGERCERKDSIGVTKTGGLATRLRSPGPARTDVGSWPLVEQVPEVMICLMHWASIAPGTSRQSEIGSPE